MPSLRGMGIRRNDRAKAPPAVAFRCVEHGRLNIPGHPGCGCLSPLSRAQLQDDAELKACRAMKWQDERTGKPTGRKRRLDYEAIAWAGGTLEAVGRQFGCSAEMVSKIRRMGS